MEEDTDDSDTLSDSFYVQMVSEEKEVFMMESVQSSTSGLFLLWLMGQYYLLN